MSYLDLREVAKLSKNDIDSMVKRAIIKEKAVNARILYAGVNPSNHQTMIVRKIVELYRGKYFYEETVFNPVLKSIHSTISTCDHEFHKIIPPQELLYQIRFKPKMFIITGTSYVRLLKDKPGYVFSSNNISEFDSKKSLYPNFRNYYLYLRLKNYLNK